MPHDPDLRPSGVLANTLGTDDPERLAQYEADVTGLAIALMALDPTPGDFDLAHLKAIHRDIFQDVYPFAGELRTIDMAKGNSWFAPASTLQGVFPQIESQINALRVARDDWPELAADVMSDLNAAHPFREGNGRTTRMFMRQLAQTAGIDLEFERVSPRAWHDASVLAFIGDNSQLADIIRAIAIMRPREIDRDLEQERTVPQLTR